MSRPAPTVSSISRGLAASLAGEHLDLGGQAFGYTRREPLGVVAGIGAWNYPLQIACWKSAPALACGNAMLFKPAELTPLTADSAGRSAGAGGACRQGVFQVVQGYADTGRLLTRHPQIRKVSLTGEVGTGRAVMADAAATLKQVTLELGGKSPLIVFDDARIRQRRGGRAARQFLLGRRGLFERHARIRSPPHQGRIPRTPARRAPPRCGSAIRWIRPRRSAR